MLLVMHSSIQTNSDSLSHRPSIDFVKGLGTMDFHGSMTDA